MKKNIFAITFLMGLIAASIAMAAVSSPCGARKPAKASPAPRVEAPTGYTRDVLDNRVPTKTVTKGDVQGDMAQATQDRDTLLSGRK